MNQYKQEASKLLDKALDNASDRWSTQSLEELKRVSLTAREEYQVWMDLLDRVDSEATLEEFKEAVRVWWRKLKKAFDSKEMV